MKKKVLANDGISKAGIDLLESKNYEVITDNIEQEKLIEYINENNISCLLVRSATKAKKNLIDSCKNLKLIGRGGVGMDNIDVEIDVRSINGELWLGHDEPQYKIEHKWIQKRRKNLWIHCKNLQAAKECWEYQAFCHSSDPYVYTSTGKIWLHDLSLKIDDDVIIPLMDDPDLYLLHNVKPYGVCTDYPSLV